MSSAGNRQVQSHILTSVTVLSDCLAHHCLLLACLGSSRNHAVLRLFYTVDHCTKMAVPGGQDTEKAMKMAQQEMDYRVDLYNRCFKSRQKLTYATSDYVPDAHCLQDGCVLL